MPMFGQYTFVPYYNKTSTWVPIYYRDPEPTESECSGFKEKQIKEMEKKNPRLANQLKSVVAREQMVKEFKHSSEFGVSNYSRTKASPKRGKKVRKKK